MVPHLKNQLQNQFDVIHLREYEINGFVKIAFPIFFPPLSITLANYRFLPEFIVLILFFFLSKPVIDGGGGSSLVCYKRYPAVFCSTCTCASKYTLAHFLSLKLCVLLCNLVYLESVLVRLRGRVLCFPALFIIIIKKSLHFSSCPCTVSSTACPVESYRNRRNAVVSVD